MLLSETLLVVSAGGVPGVVALTGCRRAADLQEEAYSRELAEWDKKIAERTNELVSFLCCSMPHTV